MTGPRRRNGAVAGPGVGVGVSVVAGLGAWSLLAAWAGPLLLPRPTDVLAALAADPERLGRALAETGLAAFGGLGIAALAGVLAAAAGWWSRVLRQALTPWTVLVQVVPIVAIAPLLVVWLGYGLGVALCTASIAAFYPVYAAAQSGLRAPSADLVDLFRLIGASRLQELVQLRAWAALPSLFAGFRTAAGLAVIGAIVGEFVGSNGVPPTLGYTVLVASRSARPDQAFAAIFLAAALALGLGLAIGALERRVIGRWYGS
jgi:NitT/TauT family transport system permease protein